MMVMPKPEEEAAPSATPRRRHAAEGRAKLGMTKTQQAARRAAVQTLDEQGYEPVRLADWHPGHDPARADRRDDTGAERAFFFVKRDFVGNDDATASSLGCACQRRAHERRHARLPAVRTDRRDRKAAVRVPRSDGTLQATGGTVPASTLR